MKRWNSRLHQVRLGKKVETGWWAGVGHGGRREEGGGRVTVKEKVKNEVEGALHDLLRGERVHRLHQVGLG